LDLGEYADGFVSKGLWAKVRHPNYAAEQSIWVVFYLMGVIATGEWLNWTIAGPILLMILFKGSADFSEEISASKYPMYKEYQKKVGRFIPKFKA
jgi:steroid 5-alpha reductase family enzyme